MSEPLLGTVTAASSTSVSVTIDGAATAVTAVVPQPLNPYLLGAASVGARVLGVRAGNRFYITDLISGGIQVAFTATAAGGWVITPIQTLATWTTGTGVLNLAGSITGFSATGGPVGAVFWLDGVSIGGPSYFINTVNSHLTLPTFFVRAAVSGGSHTIGLTALITSDSNDHVYVSGLITPT